MTKETVISKLFTRYPALSPVETALHQAIAAMAESYEKGHTLLVCGNGGSAADSLHFTGEMMKEFAIKRSFPPHLQDKMKELYPEDVTFFQNTLQGGLPTISLVNEIGLTTAFANDNVSDLVFAQQVLCHGKEGAVLFCLSTSGNSKNVIHAAKIAKVMGMSVISMTGETGGELKKYSDILLNVPEKETYLVQEYHLPLYHAIAAALELEFFGG